MIGHTIQKCYKIHGGSWLEDIHSVNETHNSHSLQTPAMSLATLNAKQYQQLLQLPSKQSMDINYSGHSASVGTCFMASNDSFFLMLPWKVVIGL